MRYITMRHIDTEQIVRTASINSNEVIRGHVFSVVYVYLDHLSYVLCVLMVEGMSVVVNVMLSLMSVMSPPPALCNLSVRTVVKLCTLGVLALGVSLVS